MATTSQQDFLRDAARALGLTQAELAKRMHAPLTTFKKWLTPEGSDNARAMPEIAWQLVREIILNESLQTQVNALINQEGTGSR
jgi:aspartate carbamoyltransferase catalytic subunit